jgi:DNA adenine methylase
MNYMGSKRRCAKWLIPYIQEQIDENAVECYWEPLGGANAIDKVRCNRRVYSDANRYVVALLAHVAETGGEDLPERVTLEDYRSAKDRPEEHPDWWVGLLGMCSYRNKFFGGFSGNASNGTNCPKQLMDGLKKQAALLKGIEFVHSDYRDIEFPKGCLIYCDPPYRGTTGYWRGLSKFDHEEYYAWVRRLSMDHIVLCSESWMPEDFDVVAEGEVRSQVGVVRAPQTERLFRLHI